MSFCIYETLVLQVGTRSKKKRQGRPVANPDEGVKSKMITMRTTPETHEKLCEGATFKGLSLSEWLIGLGLRAAERQHRAARTKAAKGR